MKVNKKVPRLHGFSDSAKRVNALETGSVCPVRAVAAGPDVGCVSITPCLLRSTGAIRKTPQAGAASPLAAPQSCLSLVFAMSPGRARSSPAAGTLHWAVTCLWATVSPTVSSSFCISCLRTRCSLSPTLTLAFRLSVRAGVRIYF